ncbi:hypothetical protein GQR58_029779 [Nymphon striatum]|nr:hypothetical protein GQR58_029779 [Nymphon striatum]
MIDTGASRTVISQNLISHLGIEMEPTQTVFQLPNSQSLVSAGKATVHIELSNHSRFHDVGCEVVTNLAVPFILGIDFLTATKCCLNLFTDELLIDGHLLPLQRVNQVPQLVCGVMTDWVKSSSLSTASDVDEEWLSEKHETCTFLEDFNVATTRIAEAAKNKETANHLPEVKKCIADLKTFLKSFDQELKSSATFVFWRQYMDIVQILLQFISAEREGLWQLHLSSFARMLPWMAVYDHIDYLRWGTVYPSDMYQLATTAPVVFDEFEKGNFVVKESDGKFNQVSADLALEHVTRLAEDTRTMFGIQPSGPSTTKAEPEHKESGKKRMKKDEADVLHLVNQFTRFKVFDRNESERICISTNDVAPPDVAKDLLHAESNGKKVVETFINERLTDKTRSLYDRVSKQNSKTFAAMTSEGGRKVDLKQVLSYELTEVPYALSNADGTIRTTDKAALAHILADEYTETCLPAANGKSTCCIIDGMALVQSIGNPARCTSFGDLADTFVRSVHSCLTDSCTRVDVPFDHYCTLPAFHAVTGCDSTSQFAGHGKKKAWQAYIKDPTVLNQFGRAEVSERLMSNAEKFVVQMYAPGSAEMSINALRASMFRGKNPEALPPTKHALDLHLKRAHMQASVWFSATESSPEQLSPEEFGWIKNSRGQYSPQWSTQDPVPKLAPN